MIVEDELEFSVEGHNLSSEVYLDYARLNPASITPSIENHQHPGPPQSLLDIIKNIRDYQQQVNFHRLRESLMESMYSERRRSVLLDGDE